MRIQKVSFSNLNSLYGTWEIDFTHEEYLTDGLFAITGPTGAGKTTILDAICLALYGRTPRLDSVGAQSNEIMSRQRAECFSEVTFETHEGVFRCAWAQHRARNRVDGNLVQARHELIDATTGTVLQSKKRDVAQAVERYTGMTFERFTRSMLLAQGQFAAFLNADADQRAPILEQITGTEIYSSISRLVHDRRREHEQKLIRMSADLHSFAPLSDEQIVILKGRESLQIRWEEGSARRLEAAQRAYDLLNKRGELHASHTELTRELSAIEEKRPQVDALRIVYNRSVSALEIEPLYQRIESLRTEGLSDDEKYSDEQTKLTELLKRQQSVLATEKELKERYDQVRKQWEQDQPVLAEARVTEGKLAIELRLADSVREQLMRALRDRRVCMQGAQQLHRDLGSAQSDLGQRQLWLREHEEDRLLEQILVDLQQQLSEMKRAGERRAQKLQQAHEAEQIRKRREKSRAQVNKELQAVQREIEKSDGRIAEERATMDRLLDRRTRRELEQELVHLQERRILLVKIAELKDFRRELHTGEPCPLCGALQHPYADEGLPEHSDTDNAIATIRTLLESLTEASERVQALAEEQSRLLQQKSAITASITSLKEQCEEAQEQQKRALEEASSYEKTYDDYFEAIFAVLKPFSVTMHGPDRYDFSTIEQCVRELESRKSAWAQAFAAQQRASGELRLLEGQKNQAMQSYAEEVRNVKELRKKLKASLGRSAKLAQTMCDLIGDASVQLWESQRRAEVEMADTESRKASQEASEVEHTVQLHQQSIQTIEERQKRRAEQLAEQQQIFHSTCSAHGFDSEQQFMQSRKDASSRADMQQEIESFDRRNQSCTQRLAEVSKSLELLDNQSIDSRWSQELLEQTIEWVSGEQARINRNLGALQERLESDTQRRAEFQSRKRAVARQRDEFTGYDRLNSLIGSHDGKKFRNFAQSLTFEMLIGHANEHVRNLSDRYMLTPDPERPLDIAVIDLYQAGQVRSAKNLSGGESFLVSLALSLALSTIASKRVQVDSLFLDEGFGSLDEETLETALTALSTLRSQGKLVGIISHVGALQERIPVQISVIPVAGGVSRIQGPGCSSRS